MLRYIYGIHWNIAYNETTSLAAAGVLNDWYCSSWLPIPRERNISKRPSWALSLHTDVSVASAILAELRRPERTKLWTASASNSTEDAEHPREGSIVAVGKATREEGKEERHWRPPRRVDEDRLQSRKHSCQRCYCRD